MFSSLVETVDRFEDAEIIRGETGSVRGVRNKVRSGIATFIDGPIEKVRHSNDCFQFLAHPLECSLCSREESDYVHHIPWDHKTDQGKMCSC